MQEIGETKDPPASTAGKNRLKRVIGSDHLEHTALEMTATDRPGLFSEISAALDSLHCNIKEAHAWSHNRRLACVAYISEQSSDTPIDDPCRLVSIEEHLTTVLRGTTAPTDMKQKEVKAADVVGRESMMTNVERRLHQLMLSVRDFDMPTFPSISTRPSSESQSDERRKPAVSIENFLLSSNVKSNIVGTEHFQGVKLELCTNNRVGLLSDITRVLRENGLAVVRADVETQGEKAINAFYVRDMSGNNVDMDFVESVKKEMGHPIYLQVKNETGSKASSPRRHCFSVADILKSHIGRFSHALLLHRVV